MDIKENINSFTISVTISDKNKKTIEGQLIMEYIEQKPPLSSFIKVQIFPFESINQYSGKMTNKKSEKAKTMNFEKLFKLFKQEKEKIKFEILDGCYLLIYLPRYTLQFEIKLKLTKENLMKKILFQQLKMKQNIEALENRIKNLEEKNQLERINNINFQENMINQISKKFEEILQNYVKQPKNQKENLKQKNLTNEAQNILKEITEIEDQSKSFQKRFIASIFSKCLQQDPSKVFKFDLKPVQNTSQIQRIQFYISSIQYQSEAFGKTKINRRYLTFSTFESSKKYEISIKIIQTGNGRFLFGICPINYLEEINFLKDNWSVDEMKQNKLQDVFAVLSNGYCININQYFFQNDLQNNDVLEFNVDIKKNKFEIYKGFATCRGNLKDDKNYQFFIGFYGDGQHDGQMDSRNQKLLISVNIL